ncbi:MAG: flagellar basal body L-ring protein FlgH [Gammaproteobacteria bacterium]|nr:flagellar basal body L-ring protein FlgH [Gammaproteobacteria bacterium]
MKSIARLTLSFLCTALTACALPGIEQQTHMPPMAVPPVYQQPESGTIYSTGTDIRLFEDQKAARVGDILTVRLAEKTNATKNSQTTTGKTTEAELGNPTVFGRSLSHDGTPLFQGSLSGSQTFDGKGASSQSNSLEGDITVTVIERLPNGNLVIAGEKWVTLNQGQEFIRLSGIIRPNDIEPDNYLLSTRIANAQITYSSKGVLAAANRMGLISRFFHSVLYPY